MESLASKNTNKAFIPGDRVVQLDSLYKATVIECGSLRSMFNKYGDSIFNANEFNYELIDIPNLKVCVVQFDGRTDYALMSCKDLEIVE